MRSQTLTRLGLIAALALSLAACGVGKRQSPVGSDDEAGQTKPVQIEEDKPAFYVTKSGDTLRSIAGREEIYGEPDLWPLILDANGDALGTQTPKSKLQAGIRLSIPRGQDQDALSDAREKARQVAAASKGHPKARVQEAPVVNEYAKAAALRPTPVAKAAVKKPTAVAVVAKPAAEEPRPVPKAKKTGGLLPVLFFLLLLLAVLSAVLFYFTRRDQKDHEA
jgi:hypothetical protein